MTKCAITGNVTDLGLQPIAGARILFSPVNRAPVSVGGKVAIPEDTEAVSQDDGSIERDLIPALYHVTGSTNTASTRPVTITVPTQATADLSALIGAMSPPPLSAAEQAALDAIQARVDAGNSAAAAAASETAAGTSATAASTSASAADTSATQASTARNQAIVAKEASEAARDTAQAQATASASSATAALSDRQAAQTARTSAETAQSAAQTAKTGAESARDAAQTARDASEAAATAAGGHVTAAETAATNAGTSASAASASATAAGASATNAAQSATFAEQSKDEAAVSANAAQASQTSAAASQATASSAANTATAQASAAATSASQAATHSDTAQNAANQAASSAAASGASATAASSSEANAASSATAAGASATNAATSANNAAASTTEAQGFASDAEAAAATATSVTGLDQGVNTTDSPSFAGLTVDGREIPPSKAEILFPASETPFPAGWYDTGLRLLSGASERAILTNNIASIITATITPVLGDLEDGDTIASAMSANYDQTSNYASTVGTISAVVAAVTVNGTSALFTDTVDAGDVVVVTVTVTDSAANERVFNAGTQAVADIAPVATGGIADQSFTDDVAITPLDVSTDFTGTRLTFALAPSSAALPAGLSLSSAGVISGTPTTVAAQVNIVVRATNSAGTADTAFGVTIAEASTFPASVVSAHSVARRVNPDYTGDLIRVRRSSDNAEANIGFDGTGALDEAALLAHVGTSGTDNGFLVKVYEQSGDVNAVDYQQTTAGLQPKIVDAGVIVKRGGIPAADQTGASLDFNDAWTTRPTDATAMAVWEAESTEAFVAYLTTPDASGTPYYFLAEDGSTSGLITVNSTTFPEIYKNGAFVGQRGDGTTRDDLHTAFAVDTPVILRSQGMDFTYNVLFDALATAYRDAGLAGPRYWFEEIIVNSPAVGDVGTLEADQAAFYGITLAGA